MDNSRDGVDLLAQLAALQTAFAETIDVVDAAAAVPWCGDWRVADLAEHLTYIHHWAAAMARSQDAAPLPTSGGLRDRYEECATELRQTLTALDPNAPARTLVENGTVAFWHRRQVHETLIHLWDLRTAGGLPLAGDPLLWADAVDEAVTVMHPRQVLLGRAPEASVRVVLAATDVDRSWTPPVAVGTTDGPAATVSGPSEALALLVWGRTGIADARLHTDGDEAALTAVLTDHFLP